MWSTRNSGWRHHDHKYPENPCAHPTLAPGEYSMMRCDSWPKKLFVKLVLSGLPSGWTCGICLVCSLSLLFNLFAPQTDGFTFQGSDIWLQSVMPIAMVNFHVLLGKYRINCQGRYVSSARSCTWARWTMDYTRGEHDIFSPRLTKNVSVHIWLGWRHVPSSPSSLGCCHDQLCWNLKSIMALWVSACKTKVPYTR